MTGTALDRHILVLRDFANTFDQEAGTDALGGPLDLRRWLEQYELIPPTGAGADRSDLALGHELRSGLRGAMADHHDGLETPQPTLDEVARQLPLRVEFGAHGPLLAPVHDGIRGGLARLLIAITTARADGSWRRLKLCRASDCAWAFYDASKNRSRSWCSMGVCGNRSKTRTYRARQREAGSTA